MTFCSDKQDKSEIINKVIKDGNEYTIQYIDDSINQYYYYKNTHLEELEKLMIYQASKRDELEYKKTNFNKWKSMLYFIVSLSISCACINKNLLILACFGFLLTLITFYNCIYNTTRLNELKKYRILLNNYKEIKNNPKINEIIEHESYYRKDINIFNIDDISIYDMKKIEKELKKIK